MLLTRIIIKSLWLNKRTMIEVENKQTSVAFTAVWWTVPFLESVVRRRDTWILVQMFEQTYECVVCTLYLSRVLFTNGAVEFRIAITLNKLWGILNNHHSCLQHQQAIVCCLLRKQAFILGKDISFIGRI